LGTLVSRRAEAQSALPAANEGALSARVAAVPESITPSPMAKTRNPAATRSLCFLKNCNASRAAATTSLTPSIPHAAAWRLRWVTNVPAIPNSPPRATNHGNDIPGLFHGGAPHHIHLSSSPNPEVPETHLPKSRPIGPNLKVGGPGAECALRRSLVAVFEFEGKEVDPARPVAGKHAATRGRIAGEGGDHRPRRQVPHLERLVLGGGDRLHQIRRHRHRIHMAAVPGRWRGHKP